MIKKLLLPLFLLSIGIVFYSLATATIERTLYFQEEITRSDDIYPFRNSSLRHLAPEEINKLTLRYKNELTNLDYLKSITIAIISLCGILVIAIIVFKPDFSVKKFDAITVMTVYTFLICITFTVFKIFTDGSFEDGHNATIKIRGTIKIILLITTPMIFFTALKLNKFEISKNMHQSKWITNLAIVLTLLSGLIAFVIGIGFLSTPDVSTFTN
ncbi:MAG: hypothetical protein ACR2IL_09995 [Chitinophagaceae bacterium]